MATVCGLTIVRKFNYRTNPNEEFSNTYHFVGPPPGNPASWDVLVNDVVNHEKPLFPGTVVYVRAYGYDSDDPNANHVYAKDFAVPGPPPQGTHPVAGTQMAGDQAALIQWRLNRTSVKGKPLYLRKYMHGGFLNSSNGDYLETSYVQAIRAFANIQTGINVVNGGLRSRSHDDRVQADMSHDYVTTRTLKRRGKRPRTGA